MRALYLILLAVSLLSPVRSFADTATQEKLSKDLLGSWLVTVAYEGRTRLLKITEVSQGSDGVYPLTAVYGWSDGNQTPIKAEFQDGGIKKLTVVTQADSVISASQDSNTTYIGTFTTKNGASKGLRITRIDDKQLSDKTFGFEKPDGMVPEKCASFFGIWKGSWTAGYIEEQTLKVRKVALVGNDCMATFTYGDTTSDPKNFSTIKMDNQESLSFVCNRSTGGTCTFTVKGNELWANYSNPSGGSNSGVFKKQQ